MKYALALTLSLLTRAAFADGFICDNTQQHLQVRVYNHTESPRLAERAAAMIVSDTNGGAGKRTIAAFYDDSQALANEGANYIAVVTADPNAQSESIAGIPLNAISRIGLEVAYMASEPIDAGVTVPGLLRLVDVQGEHTDLSVNCTRYITAAR